MQVILLEHVAKLGHIGDVVSVKPGFARNYLLPRGKALRASEDNKRLFEARRAQVVAENDRRREDAQGRAGDIEGKSVILIRQASDVGALYGSVSARNIADSLDEIDIKVTKAQIILDRPIKTLGVHAVRVMLHPEVTVMIDVNVARSAEEAELQAQGVDIVAARHADEQDELAAEQAEQAEQDAADAAEAEDQDEAQSAESTESPPGDAPDA